MGGGGGQAGGGGPSAVGTLCTVPSLLLPVSRNVPDPLPTQTPKCPPLTPKFHPAPCPCPPPRDPPVSDYRPHQFLHMPEAELESCLAGVKDAALRHCLGFGIGLHHAGLNDKDRSLAERLFVECKIQVGGGRGLQRLVKRSVAK